MMSLVAPGVAALRFYGWDPFCLSLGRNQPAPQVHDGRARAELASGRDIVRRPTGGRSVFHGPELTYAVACHDRAFGGPRALYATIHRGIAVGLRGLGVRFDDGPAENHGADLSPDARACFRDPAPGELTIGGRKLVGSAQWRHGGRLLQHGSILIEDRQAVADLDAPGSAPGDRVTGAIGLRDVLATRPGAGDIAAALFRSLSRELGVEPTDPPLSVERLPVTRIDRYRSAAWAWEGDAASPGGRSGGLQDVRAQAAFVRDDVTPQDVGPDARG
ncbi:MAG: hypothetical protein MJB57_00770 [Gemmatimonadetes bacterium]|nr:hypothetical protein [Gemmatimonadota bacterium]